MSCFQSDLGFCPDCGSIFPPLGTMGNITCYKCKREFHPEVLGSMDIEYSIHFNSYTPKEQRLLKTDQDGEFDDGPIVERKCPKCGHDKMTYATVQLRSADEGQTVFFTCVNCKHKETENS